MEQETNNHDAPREQPGNPRNGPYVLNAIGFLPGLAIWKDRVNHPPVVYIERVQAADDACDGILYVRRRMPHYYASDPAVDSTHPLFYVDMRHDRRIH